MDGNARLHVIADLLDRIAKDAAVARAACHDADGERSGQWRPAPRPEEHRPNECDLIEDRDGGVQKYWTDPVANFRWGVALEADLAVGLHMARHDPARVLADCEAKMQILAQCSSDPAIAERILPLLAALLPEERR